MEDISSGRANNFPDVRNTTRIFWRNREPESQTWAENSRKTLPCGRYQLWRGSIPLQGWWWTNGLSEQFPLGQSITSLGMWLTIGLSPPWHSCHRMALPACWSHTWLVNHRRLKSHELMILHLADFSTKDCALSSKQNKAEIQLQLCNFTTQLELYIFVSKRVLKVMTFQIVPLKRFGSIRARWSYHALYVCARMELTVLRRNQM